ncbi:DEAD/DEAH box helicase family protein [Flavobacterium sp. ABG]|uniref:restriction endonuclease n=1 Tax=Flavobacterium sp. ABG TaxID=1423322 RepID=UPI0006499832|nr:DEAD/DEAH box helicase family protein [Flavobacterium sp. ABG]KLT68716.1 DEAD/DEAH box helicase [Flavobacterium sp. ABG]
MKIQFDSTQDYQSKAVNSIINIFEGQPLAKSDFEFSFAMEGASLAFTEKGVANNLLLEKNQILQNVQKIQIENDIEESEGLIESLSDDQKTLFNPLNFTIEMETGTGKTYTFLKTIYELNNVYNFKKFVIVVPSVAIREGTLKNLQITHDHFQSIYDNPPINFIMYERNNLTGLRNFATSNALQILVINIDSFTKDNNVINTLRETGVKPIEYIQYTNPIVIIDEPQNFETDIRRQAIGNLNPMCTLRYSATHKNLYNLVYSLNPVQAYDLGLVKQIEVDGITSDNSYNSAFIHYKGVQLGKKNLKAKLSIYVNENGGIKQKEISVNIGEDLFDLSNKRETYKDGFILNSINASEGYIEFSNGLLLKEGETQGGLNDEVMKFQIERTVKWHFEKVKKFKHLKLKVLSLFFIDKVVNYREYDIDGNTSNGKFAIWFEEAFNKYQKLNPEIIPFSCNEVHNGYFSSDKTGKGKDKKEIWIDSKEKNTQKDDGTYSLIMREKERLLSIDEPLQFIFSHSALREGWDNPNVFQICTLNESKSELKKRQEIGRGLRLPVDNDGQRIHDKTINILTVIANETYEDFSKALQNEIQEETSIEFKDRIKNTRDKVQIQLNKELTIENYPLLFEIWERISQKTRYSVDYNTNELIRLSVEKIQKMPVTKRPILESKTAHLNYSTDGIESKLTDISVKRTEELRYQIPDVYGYIQSKVDITRKTIYEILTQSDRYAELEINPQMYLDNILNCIQQTLNTLLVEGIKYEEINGQKYEMTLFKFEEIETYLSNLFKASQTNKTVFDYVAVDSNIESDFARDCEADENVKFFFKLPKKFKIPTPIGNYVPDWAIVFDNDNRIYFVAETKGTLNKQLLRDVEKMKIECGEKHFALFSKSNVEYKLAVTTQDLH